MPSPPRRDTRERELLSAYGQLGDANEVLNERAVAVMKRMSDKLTGRDFLQVMALLLCDTPYHQMSLSGCPSGKELGPPACEGWPHDAYVCRMIEKLTMSMQIPSGYVMCRMVCWGTQRAIACRARCSDSFCKHVAMRIFASPT